MRRAAERRGHEHGHLTNWTCTVDDTPCVWFSQVVRAQSDARPFKIPVGSIFTALGYAPGRREIALADGYWVMLDPLPLGEHTIHFTAEAAEPWLFARGHLSPDGREVSELVGPAPFASKLVSDSRPASAYALAFKERVRSAS